MPKSNIGSPRREGQNLRLTIDVDGVQVEATCLWLGPGKGFAHAPIVETHAISHRPDMKDVFSAVNARIGQYTRDRVDELGALFA